MCVESPKESCENKQNEIWTVIQNESLEKLYDKSSDELREESQHELAENQKKEIALNEVVNLAYRGNKHTHIWGKNSERRDVLYKNFLRATRRFLWSIFEKEYDTTKYRYFKASNLYKTHVEEFYSKHFKRYVNTESNMNEERHKDICFALSIILTKNFSFPNKTTKQMKFANGLNKVCLRFALSEFKKVLAKEYIRDFFRVFKESGFLDLMLDTYPVLTKFKKMYYLVVDSIQDFECTQELMK